jgi:hypothetical protein
MKHVLKDVSIDDILIDGTTSSLHIRWLKKKICGVVNKKYKTKISPDNLVIASVKNCAASHQ